MKNGIVMFLRNFCAVFKNSLTTSVRIQLDLLKMAPVIGVLWILGSIGIVLGSVALYLHHGLWIALATYMVVGTIYNICGFWLYGSLIEAMRE